MSKLSRYSLKIILFTGIMFLSSGIQTGVQAQVENAPIKCQIKVAPRINVTPSKSNVRYDFTRSKAELNRFDVDTISPYGPRHKTTVSGLMSGAIRVQSRVSFMHETYAQLGLGCVYLKSVDVKVHINPTIYIAREYKQGSCMHTAVLVHERKHVREDQLIVNKYAKIIGQAIKAVVNSQDGAFGPFETERIPFVQQNVQNSIQKIVKKYNQKMNEERQERQQAIDTLEEYESIGARCKDR
ncbi:MAG: hypothetical protein MRY79_02340 [Alphaproteobacteria bacterium]|nr:hypothetical protein [Alphaproteobacteria bacterium]